MMQEKLIHLNPTSNIKTFKAHNSICWSFMHVHSLPPEIRVLLQPSLEILEPVLDDVQCDVGLGRISCHLRLSDGKRGRIIKEILQHFLWEFHKRVYFGDIGSGLRGLLSQLSEGLDRDPHLTHVWNVRHGLGEWVLVYHRTFFDVGDFEYCTWFCVGNMPQQGPGLSLWIREGKIHCCSKAIREWNLTGQKDHQVIDVVCIWDVE